MENVFFFDCFSFKIRSDKFLHDFTKSLSHSNIMVWSLLFNLFVGVNNYIEAVIKYGIIVSVEIEYDIENTH